MKYPVPLVEARLLRRYKRFLADVEMLDGAKITAHTANTGAMTGCSEPGSRVWLSRSNNERRKYAFTWELVEVNPDNSTIVGINTLLANHLVKEAIESGVVNELLNYNSIRTEVPYGEEKSRVDLLLTSAHNVTDDRPCYVEVKNVTLADDGVAYFPDAKSERAIKHLRELTSMVGQGARAVIFFCVARGDVQQVRPADFIDDRYGSALRQACSHGVEAIAYSARVNPREISLVKSVPVNLELN